MDNLDFKLNFLSLILCVGIGACMGQVTLRAEFSMVGISGNIDFTEDGSDITIATSLQGVTEDMQWEIHEYPVDWDKAEHCSDSVLGSRFQDTDGNLTDQYGVITAANQNSISVSNTVLKLSTTDASIAGRSVLVYTPSMRACATINNINGYYTAMATFPASIGGRVVFRQANQTNAEMSILSELFFIDGTSVAINGTTTQLEIYTGSVSADLGESVAVADRCTNIGSIFNPSGATGNNVPGVVGPVSVDVSEPTSKTFQNNNAKISLTGTNSIVGKSLVVVSGGTVIACANIIAIESKTVMATFDMDGVKGSVSFTQASPFDVTHTNIEFTGLQSLAGGFHIHLYPVPPRFTEDATQCSSASVAGHFNPFGISSYPAPGSGTNDQYEIGDLSGKYGNILASQSNVTSSFTDWNMPLWGVNSIIGRSVVIHKANDGSRWVCASIGYPGDVRTAKVTFTYPVIGHMIFREPMNEPLGQTTVYVELMYGNGETPSVDHKWHVHVDPIKADFMSDTGRCASCQGHYNPYSVDLSATYSSCSSSNQLRCEVGDLSGKHGKIGIGNSGSGLWYHNFYTDIDLPLNGPQSIVGRSVTIHAKDSGASRLACANIHLENAVKVRVSTWVTSPPDGEVAIEQSTLFDPTILSVGFTGLAQEISSYHVHEFSINGDEEVECSGASVGGHFNPFQVSTFPAAGTGTTDEYEIGDLSGKFGGVTNLNTYDATLSDFNLPVSGPQSIVGRSIVLHKTTDGSRVTCGNIENVLPSGSQLITATAKFEGTVEGKIEFSQVKYSDGTLGNTNIEVLLEYAVSSNQTTGHNWHVHVYQQEDGESSTCTSNGGHYNPFLVAIDVSTFIF
ncbi:unnamed protein product [Owenia fusiformis]|uniref:Superoxide dismutase copper/zinc binding domain-containing protein n=1 Tax=Owenia fusiformis TaxID=6347 RepID=A0A8J1T8M4_OWEFU|nr:unnamed protein product [Owenia fusiformis]